MATAIEASGFEIRDSIVWLYGSGFPKSYDISKGIDRKRDDSAEVYKVTAWIREARDAAGVTNREIDDAFGFAGMSGHWTSSKSQPSVPTLEQVPTLLDVLGVAVQNVPDDIRGLLWDINGRKGQPGENWTKRKVVGSAVVPVGHAFAGPVYGGDSSSAVVPITAPATDAARKWEGWGTALKPAHEPIVVARKPLIGTVAANVQEYGTGAINIDGTRIATDGENFDALKGRPIQKLATRRADETDEQYRERVLESPGQQRALEKLKTLGRWPANVITDGTIEAEWVRFFYCAKASKAERHTGGIVNTHPTAKPLALMRYLVRLVTPPGGTVLEPFAGSGTTIAAAILEGFDVIGCEMTDEYLPIIDGRIAWAHAEREREDSEPKMLFGGEAA
jgi:hypothetical protein